MVYDVVGVGSITEEFLKEEIIRLRAIMMMTMFLFDILLNKTKSIECLHIYSIVSGRIDLFCNPQEVIMNISS